MFSMDDGHGNPQTHGILPQNAIVLGHVNRKLMFAEAK
jgi:hypothetical protein